MVMKRYIARCLSLVLLVIAATAACDSSPLTAPVASTISISALDTTLLPGGSTEVTAVVIEEAGTAVHDGTQVRFTSTLGRVEPETVTTGDGVARATFRAGATAGTARVTASSGAASGSGTATSDTPTSGTLGSVVEITIG
jgi:hypothetical protein